MRESRLCVWSIWGNGRSHCKQVCDCVREWVCVWMWESLDCACGVFEWMEGHTVNKCMIVICSCITDCDSFIKQRYCFDCYDYLYYYYYMYFYNYYLYYLYYLFAGLVHVCIRSFKVCSCGFREGKCSVRR